MENRKGKFSISQLLDHTGLEWEPAYQWQPAYRVTESSQTYNYCVDGQNQQVPMTNDAFSWTSPLGQKAEDFLPNGDRRSCFHSHMGLWLMEANALQQRVAAVLSGLATERDVSSDPALQAQMVGLTSDAKSVAVVPIHGAITKKKSKFAEASAVETRHLIRQLANDDTVGKIILHIDSPGGAVSGISDLASEIKAASKVKPIVAYIEDMGASAAYWIASQCTEIVANSGAFVGSLGTYGVLHDTSEAYKREGIKVHLVSSGGVKGGGVDGTPITKEVLADQQRIVDAITAMFKADVAGGRNMNQAHVDAMFDGRVHPASEAAKMGLIDRIGTFESIVAGEPLLELEEEEEEKEEDMPEEQKPETPASAFDLAEFAADILPLAEQVKAAGCPLSAESIKSKLLAAGSGATDNLEAIEKANIVAGKLVALKKLAGSFADPEPKQASTLPADYAELTKLYRVEMAKCKQSGMDAGNAVAHIAKTKPELVKALSAATPANRR